MIDDKNKYPEAPKGSRPDGAEVEQPKEHDTPVICGTCKCFDLKQQRAVEGYCRRYPPTVEKRWPSVTTTDWCGEYR